MLTIESRSAIFRFAEPRHLLLRTQCFVYTCFVGEGRSRFAGDFGVRGFRLGQRRETSATRLAD